MLKFNTKQVLANAEEEKKKPKPLPKISIKRTSQSPEQCSTQQQGGIYNIDKVMMHITHQRVAEEIKTDLVSKCWHDYNEVLIERKKLSSMIWRMVADGATTAQLKEHYEKIESYKSQLGELFDRARYAERTGQLPEVIRDISTGQPADISSLKYEKKKKSEKRSKLKVKIERGRATNAPKLAEWELELDQVEAEYNNLEERIKKMEGK